MSEIDAAVKAMEELDVGSEDSEVEVEEVEDVEEDVEETEEGEGEEDEGDSESDDGDDDEDSEDDADEEDAGDEDEDEGEPQLSRQLAAIARKEEILRERERALKKEYNEKLQNLENAYKKVKEAEKQVATQTEWQELVGGDPVYVLENSGLDKKQLSNLARAAYVLASGDEADPSIRAKVDAMRATGAAKRLELLQKKGEREKEESKNQPEVDTSRVEQYISTISEAVKNTTSHPIVARMYTKDSQRAIKEVFSAAEKLYDETGDIPTAAEALERAEKDAAELLGAPKQETSAKAKKTKTLSGRKTSVKSSKSREKRKPQTEEEEIAAAVKAMEQATSE